MPSWCPHGGMRIFTKLSRLPFRRCPEGAGLPDFCQCSDQLTSIFPNVGNPILIQPPAKIVARKEIDQVRQGEYALLGRWVKSRPVSNVLFRPEEVHSTSGKGGIFSPLPKGYGHIPHYAFRFSAQDLPVLYFDPEHEPAIQTRSIDLNSFSRK
jgi:hypothetical protein